MKKVQEKTYFECLNEISQNKLFKGLLGYGMFAERIPNFLTSSRFTDIAKIIKMRYSPNARWGISILLTRE
ncbi:hypothetical protein JP0183_03110 [Helicobacter pylori]